MMNLMNWLNVIAVESLFMKVSRNDFSFCCSLLFFNFLNTLYGFFSECYGMSDSDSLASVDSSNPDLPWFCDACRAGVNDPVCELCPNSGTFHLVFCTSL